MLQIGNYPKGYDLSLLNTIYHYPKKLKNGKWASAAMDLIIKDNITGDKFLETIIDPEYEYFYIKDDQYVDPNHSLHFIEKDKCYDEYVPNSKLERQIAERTGHLQEYMQNLYSGNKSDNYSLIHYNPRVMMSDMNIEDNIRFQFSNQYLNSYSTPTKLYLDIEVDIKNCSGEFVQPGECPINIITIVDESVPHVYSFILRNPENPLVSEFEVKANTPEMKQKIKDLILYSIQDKTEEYGLSNLEVNLMFFDNEIDLITTTFNYVNNLMRDFVLAWNMSFDIPYIIQRIINLGYDPKDIMCHPDFKYKEVSYYVDKMNYNTFEERNDYAKISSYSIYLDQMIQFASRRKGRAAFASYRLDYIGKIICGVRKLDYSDITNNIAELPYKNFETFVLYNIVDTIVQYCIEKTTNDINSVYNNVLLNNTRYSKIYRQTVYLKNRAAKSYYSNGYVIGNNTNLGNTKTQFPGAFVSDPKMNSDYSKIKIDGKPVSIYNNLNDFDYKSLYPSITSEFNMGQNTIFAHLTIPEMIYPYENRFKREDYKWCREGQFMDDLQSHNWIEFFHRWFHLANYEEMYDDIIEYFTKVRYPQGHLLIHDDFEYSIPESPDDNKIELSIYLSDSRDEEVYRTYKNGTLIESPKYDFSKSDFNSLKDIYNTLKDGYLYSKPKEVGEST